MDFLIMGAGAVGAYVGARLLESGHNVAFIARGKHLDALRKNGLKIFSNAGNLNFKNVKASDNPSTFSPPDVILFTVKLWDTETAARLCAPIMGKNTVVLTLQNGVESSKIISNILGECNVISGAIFIATQVQRPGAVRHFGDLSKIIFGENNGSTSTRAKKIQTAFVKAKIDTQISQNISITLWEKYIALVSLSAATCITRLPIRTLMHNPITCKLLEDLMLETLELSQLLGIGVSKEIIETHKAFFHNVSPQMTSSMLQDLTSGKRLELQWLSGGVVRMAKTVGLSVPVNEIVVSAITIYQNGTPKLAS